MSVGNATRTGAGAPDSDSAKQGPIVSTEGLTKGWTAVVSGDDIACHFNITNRSLSATIPTIKLSAGAWAQCVLLLGMTQSSNSARGFHGGAQACTLLSSAGSVVITTTAVRSLMFDSCSGALIMQWHKSGSQCSRWAADGRRSCRSPTPVVKSYTSPPAARYAHLRRFHFAVPPPLLHSHGVPMSRFGVIDLKRELFSSLSLVAYGPSLLQLESTRRSTKSSHCPARALCPQCACPVAR